MPTGLVSGVQNSLELRKLELVQFWMGGVGLKVLLIRHRECGYSASVPFSRLRIWIL
jgi:hypothetical protein